MVIQREGHKVIFSDLANKRIDNKECPACGKPEKEWTRRTDWRCCSTECTKRFWKEHVVVKSWQDLREKVFNRDNHKCVKCGKKTKDLIADHIVPIAIGGSEWDINNIQTLCQLCNKIKTKEDMGDIAKARMIEKKLKNGQTQLNF